MRKFDLKSIVLGLVIGTISVTTVFATGGIKSATYSSAKVYFYGEEVPLKSSLVSIVKDGASGAQIYMPMKDVLEYMNFNVKWNSSDKSVRLTMKGNNDNGDGTNDKTVDPKTLSKNEADKVALETMQSTGNWGYIEKYLPYMSKKGIDAVVNSYNSKHQNPNEFKKASDYYN